MHALASPPTDPATGRCGGPSRRPQPTVARFATARSIAASALAALAVLIAAAPASAEPSARVLRVEQERVEAIARASAATVAVFAKGGQGGGSAVVISPDGYALSNFHVTKPAGNAMKCGLPDGVLYDAVIVGIDPTGDVALIKMLGRDDFPHAPLADSDRVRAGDWCFAAGNPFLLANDFTPSVSFGVVSGVHRYQYPAGTLLEYADCIQTDAAINPGNSGGPLFNARGELIGINGRGSFEKRGRVNVGVGYAISINQIKNFLGYLKSGRVVDHATLGATVSSDDEGRVAVDNILEESDAYRRGLRYDDEIVRFGGREIHTVNAFKNVLGIYPRGWRVPLTYRRDGKSVDCLVRLTGVHPRGELEKLVRSPRTPRIGPKPKQGEKPKPGDAPREDEEPGGDEKPKRGRIPIPKLPIPKLPIPGLGKPAMPEVVARHFETRDGYVNYYFNRLNRDRVWQALTARGDFSAAPQEWTVAATLEQGGEAEIQFDETTGRITLPAGESKARFDDDLRLHLNPPASGGLLVALHVWQRMLRTGPEKFGEVFYLGTMPLRQRDGDAPRANSMVDVLVGIYGGLETRFYCDPQSGDLVGLELLPDEGVDPCEVYFADFREVEGRFLPHRWEVHHADRTFAILNVSEFRLTTNADR